MVESYAAHVDSPLSLTQLFQEAEAIRSQPFTEPYIAECAALLARLNASADLLWSHLESLNKAEDWLASFSAPQSIILGRSESFAVRANIWLPVKQSAFQAHERDLYAYHDVAHSHNFRFLTISHFGPGYLTDCFEVKSDEIEGWPGERVNFLGECQKRLTADEVLHFRPYRDVHVQREPEQLSISLNLMFRKEPRSYDQLFFDLDSRTVVSAPFDTLANRRAGAMRIAALMGDTDTLEFLDEVASSHEHVGLRINAARALAEARAMRR